MYCKERYKNFACSARQIECTGEILRQLNEEEIVEISACSEVTSKRWQIAECADVMSGTGAKACLHDADITPIAL